MAAGGTRSGTVRWPEDCPICGRTGLAETLVLSDLSVASCRHCGHRLARHEAIPRPADYHEQYDAGSFLDSLRETRRRQAGLIVDAIRRQVPDASGLLDFGAGRGWFLSECRSQGINPVAGCDTSELSVSTLRAAGLEAHLVPGDGPAVELAAGRPSFGPRILTLLDVVEHIEPAALASWLRTLLAACGDRLELVVIKVPVPGLLQVLARFVAAFGVQSPIRQIYQVGTFPPHYHCFSSRSMQILLDSIGLELLGWIGDRDFEPEWLPERMGVTGVASRLFVRAGGRVLSAAIRMTGLFDTGIFVSRPRR